MNRYDPHEIDFILAHPGSYSEATVREAERQRSAKDEDKRRLGIREARKVLSTLVHKAAAGLPTHVTVSGSPMAIIVQDPETVAYGGDDE